MANIANLAVQLTAQTGQFVAKMAAAGKPVQGWTSLVDRARVSARAFAVQIRRTAFTIGGALLAATAAAAGGLTFLTKRLVGAGLEGVDSLAKVADKLGETTENLSALGFVAGQSGNDMKKLELGLQRMTRRISDAAKGAGAALPALKELGLDPAVLSGKSPVEQFLAIADAMEQVGSSGDKVRLAFKLFDAEGVNLLNTLKGGSAAIREGMREAERLGLTFSRIDAAKVEQANDAMDKLRQMVRSVSQILAIEFAPLITAGSDRLIEMGVNGEGFGMKVLNGIELAVGGVAKLIDTLRSAPATLKTVVIGFAADTGRAVMRVNEALFSVVDFAMPAISGLFSFFASGANDAAGSFRTLGGTVLKVFGTIFAAVATGLNQVLPKSLQIDPQLFNTKGDELIAQGQRNFARSDEIQFAQRHGRTTRVMRENLEAVRQERRVFLEAFVGDLEAQEQEFLAEAMGHLEGGLSERVRDFFSDIRKRAEEAARASVGSSAEFVEGFEEIEEAAEEARKAQEAFKDSAADVGTFGQGEKGLTASGKTVTRPIFASRSGVGPVVGSSGQPVAAVSEPEGIAGAPGGSGGVAPLISRSNELLGQILGVLQRGPVAVLG